MRLLESSGVTIPGSNAVVLGRSDIVGSPVASLLRSKDATVTQCHSKTRDIPAILANADIVVAAIGKPEFVKGSWLKPGAVVIDVGINYVPGMLLIFKSQPPTDHFADATKKTGQRLVGDVDYASASTVASFITPVPGGVGPMTVAMLMENTLKSAERLFHAERSRKLKPLHLTCLKPVPSDIEISLAQTPKPITELAKEIGLLETEVESYGRNKAKIELSVLERLKHRSDGKYIVISGSAQVPANVRGWY